LTDLSCYYNDLTELPSCPELTALECGINKLTEIPMYPKLITLWCERNNIVKIPELEKLECLVCYDNPDLRVPYLKSLISLSCSGCKYFKNMSIKDTTTYIKFIEKVDVIVIVIIYFRSLSKKIGSVISSDITRLIYLYM
jgi:Leucine-rich repeat (LRR) protein